MHLRTKLENIYRNTKTSSTQQGKIHDVWHPINTIRHEKQQEKCNSWEGRAISQKPAQSWSGFRTSIWGHLNIVITVSHMFKELWEKLNIFRRGWKYLKTQVKPLDMKTTMSEVKILWMGLAKTRYLKQKMLVNFKDISVTIIQNETQTEKRILKNEPLSGIVRLY